MGGFWRKYLAFPDSSFNTRRSHARLGCQNPSYRTAPQDPPGHRPFAHRRRRTRAAGDTHPAGLRQDRQPRHRRRNRPESKRHRPLAATLGRGVAQTHRGRMHRVLGRPASGHRGRPERRVAAGQSRQVHSGASHTDPGVGVRTAGEIGPPITHWTAHEWADEARKRGIVASISASQVNRSLNEAELQPHRSRYWLNTKEKDPQQFQEKVEAVCDGSQEAPRLYAAENTHTICTEEMTGIQARERIAATLPMVPGRWKRGNSSTSVMAR